MLYDNGPRIPAVPNRMPYQPPQGLPQRPPGVADPFGGDSYLKQRYASPRGLGGTMPSPNQQPAPVYGRPPASIGGWGGQSPWQQQGYQQPQQGPQWLRRQGAPKRRPMYGMGYGGMQTIGEMQQPQQQSPYPTGMQVGLPPGFQSPTQRPYQNPFMR